MRQLIISHLEVYLYLASSYPVLREGRQVSSTYARYSHFWLTFEFQYAWYMESKRLANKNKVLLQGLFCIYLVDVV